MLLAPRLIYLYNQINDCVEMRQGPSSYMPDLMEPVDLQDVKGSIGKAFAKY